MSRVLLFSLAAAFYPTLLAATMVMLVLPHPQRLLLGYLLGRLTSAAGLLIVFWLGGSSSATRTVKDTINPVFDLVLGPWFSSSSSSWPPGATRGDGSAARAGTLPGRKKGPPKWKRAGQQRHRPHHLRHWRAP